MSEQNKLKILALHGYRQSGSVFRAKTGSLRKLLKNIAELTYVTAPHQVVNIDPEGHSEPLEPTNESTTEDKGYGWFFNRDDCTFRGTREGGPAVGYQESVEYLESVFKEHGPFDGILGFSQGACLASLLCYLRVKGLTSMDFKFAIIIAGFKSGSLPHMKYYDDPLDIPTLHIYGKTDAVIPLEMSSNLKSMFNGKYPPLEFVHEGGHFVPANGELKPAYVKFLKWMQTLDIEDVVSS